MTEAQKDTIYVDVDDEITSIIDKVQDSKNKIVALVLPKRAAVLQSIVNMKLLKRSSDTAKKNIVLITSEAGLLPLAGAVGLHVAKNLQTKPAIPTGPDTADIPESLVKEEELEDPEAEPDLDADKSVGELAGGEPAAAAPAALEAEDAIELDDEEPAKADDKDGKKPKGKKDKKLKVPNFERFRKWLLLGGLALVILLVGGYFTLFKMGKAKITVTTDTTNVNANLIITADATSKKFNEGANTVPAEKAEVKKTESQTAPATGQKNTGAKATGTVTMTARQCSGTITPPSSVPAGTGVTSNSQTYITQETTTFGTGTLSGTCVEYKAKGTTAITAQSAGTGANLQNGSTFTVTSRSDITATGSASGGTDTIVKVIAQADVDAAKAKLSTANNEQAARDELTKNLTAKGLSSIKESFASTPAAVTNTPNVGDTADNVTINSVITYSMLGLNQDNVKTLIANQAKTQIDQNKQSILDDGIATASFAMQDNSANPKINVQSTVVIGPKLDTDGIKQEIAGKKKGDTIQIISSRPGIKDVTVDYSPFWVGKTPKQATKITIEFKKASTAANGQQ